MNKEAIDEYYKVLDETVKEYAEEKFLKNGGYEIAELFDYKSVNFSDMYKPITLRSTFKEESHKFTQTDEIENLAYTEAFENLLNDMELNGISKDDHKSRIPSEMRDNVLSTNLHLQDIYWNNSYEYETKIDSDTSITDLDVSYPYIKEILAGLSALFKVEFNYHGNDQFQLFLRPDETGYLVPEYHLLKMQLDYISIEKTYGSIVTDFKLEKEANLSTASELGDFRDLMEKQLERQIAQLDKLNDQIKKILIYYYRVLEISILQLHNKERPEEKNEKAPKDWFFCLIMFKNVYDTFYMNFTEDKLIEFHCKEFDRNPYLNKDAKESLIDLIKLSYEKKKPIITVARDIALKLRVTEALIEGIIKDGSLKNVEEIVEDLTYPDLPSAIKTATKFVNEPKNKSGKYKEDIIKPVMEATRKYIIKNDIQDMYGHVAKVADDFKNSEPSKKSIENYIKYYSIEAGRYKKR